MLALETRPSLPAGQQPPTCSRRADALAARGSPLPSGTGQGASWALAPAAAGTRRSWRAQAVGPFWSSSQQVSNATIDYFNKRFDGLDKRFDIVDKRFDGVDKRFDGVDKRFDGVDKRFDSADKDLKAVKSQLESIEGFVRPNMWSFLERLGRFLFWVVGMAGAICMILRYRRGV